MGHDSRIDDWVYNEANIDGGRIVWARDMGEERNRELLQYYCNRSVWYLNADEVPPKLMPYADAPVFSESFSVRP